MDAVRAMNPTPGAYTARELSTAGNTGESGEWGMTGEAGAMSASGAMSESDGGPAERGTAPGMPGIPGVPGGGPMPLSTSMPSAGAPPHAEPMPPAGTTPPAAPPMPATPVQPPGPAATSPGPASPTPPASAPPAPGAPAAGAPVSGAPAPAPGRYGRSGLPARTPLSVPLLPPELADGQPRPRRGDPVARRAGRALRKVFASSPAAETAAVTQAAHAIQQPVTTGRQIAVSSIRGGAGKSTLAALLALTYAHYRSDPVLAVEADPALGTLPHRLGAREVRWSGSDLAQIVEPSMLITDLTGYLLPFAGGGWLLPGSQGAIGTRLDLDTYRVVMTSLRRHFAATVVDCETLPAEVARTALVTTQARVVATPATPEGVAATRSVLDWIGGLHSGLLPTTVVVLTHTSPDSGVDVRRAAEHLGAGGAAVLPLPYDRHLAAGGAIRTELLGERTREAAARIAAEVMDRAVSREPGRRQQQRQTTVHRPGQPPVYVPGQATAPAPPQEPQRPQGHGGQQGQAQPQAGPQSQAQAGPQAPAQPQAGPQSQPQAQPQAVPQPQPPHQPQPAPHYYPPQATPPVPAPHQPPPHPQAQAAPTQPPSPSPSQPPSQPLPTMPVAPQPAAGPEAPGAPAAPDRRSPFDGGPVH
ncbi:hypothetical protein Spla01_06452 [Streptomyces platensis]|uniref:CobQ/CobB/MinD/ParA nucleotide binding domain protein n=2 Tax=Streptomyces platensis TaxID=58346 RepID=A0ABX3XZ07_STRPT|nr:hypothetical protein BG653_02558 [Streptomyces platensis]